MAEDNLMPDSSATPTGDSYDSSISNTPDTTPDTTNKEPEVMEDFKGFGGFGDIQAAQSIVGASTAPYAGYIQNPTDLENRYHAAAVNQGVFAALGQGLQRGVFGEIVGGTLEGFGALGNIWGGGGEYNGYQERNWLESIGNAIREGQDENTEIWERNQGETWAFGDAAWWAKNMPSMMSTISMMIPGAAVGKAAAMAGRSAAKVARASAKVADAMANTTRTIAGAVTMRHAENMREAHDVFARSREEFLNDARGLNEFKGTDAWKSFVRENGRKPFNKHELGDYIGGSSAKKSYMVNGSNIFFDIIQMHALGKALRGTRGGLSGVAARKAAGENVGRLAVAQERLANLTKFGIMDMGTEGIEELVNYVGTEEGMYHGRLMAGRTEETNFEDRYKGYVQDDHFWEAGFLGAMGGAVFTGISSAAGYAARSKRQKAMMETAAERKEAIRKAATLQDKVAKGEITAAEAAQETRRQFFDMGVKAAYSGQSDVAENQLAILEQEMETQGASKAEIEAAMETARAQMKLAEEAVGESRLLARNLGLSATETQLLSSSLINNTFAQQAISDRRAELTKELENIKGTEEGRRDHLVTRRDMLESQLEEAKKNGKPTKGIETRIDIVNELIGATESLETTSLAELAKKSKELAAKAETVVDKDAKEATEKELAEIQEKIEDLKSKKDNQTESTAKRALADALAEQFEAEKATQEKLDKINKGEEKLKEEDQKQLDEITAEVIRRATNPIDERISEDAALEEEGEYQKFERGYMTSEEGLGKITEAATKVDAARKLKEDKEFQEYLKGATASQLERDLKKEEDADKKAAIKARLEALKKEELNKAKQETQERSKDIIVPGPVQEVIDQLLANSENVVLDENGEYYVDKRTGKRYVRTTTWIQTATGEKKTEIDSKWEPSSHIGNSIDVFIRDFFDGATEAQLMNAEEYINLPVELRKELIEGMKNLEKKFLQNGEKVIAKDVVLFNDMDVNDTNAAGVAGTVDLLTVDKDGNFRIYDMKTMRNGTKVFKQDKVSLDGVLRSEASGSDTFGRVGKYQRQLSTYRLMLMNQFGVNVPEVGLIPVDVIYEADSKRTSEENALVTTDRADYLGLATLEPSAELFGMTEPEITFDPTATNNAEENQDEVPEDNVPDNKDTKQKELLSNSILYTQTKLEMALEDKNRLKASKETSGARWVKVNKEIKRLEGNISAMTQELAELNGREAAEATTDTEATAVVEQRLEEIEDAIAKAESRLESLKYLQIQKGANNFAQQELESRFIKALNEEKAELTGANTQGTPNEQEIAKLEEQIAATEFEVARRAEQMKFQIEQGAGKQSPAYKVSEKIKAKEEAKLEALREKLAALKASEKPTEDENSTPPADEHDESGATTVVANLESDQVPFASEFLLNYFIQRLQVAEEPGREGQGYLVHTANGPVQIGDDLTAAQYSAIMGVISGTNPQPVTFEIVGEGKVTSAELTTKMRMSDETLGLLGSPETNEKGERTYNFTGTAGDSLIVVMKIGDTVVGTLPQTAQLVQAAHDRGLSNMFSKRVGAFGTESRKGKVVANENSMMTEIGTQQHLENAVAMHALRVKLWNAHKEGATEVAVALTTGETGFGQLAQGGLIYSTTPMFASENAELADYIRRHGWGLQMPSSNGKNMQIEVAGEGTHKVVAPYQQSEARGRNSRGDMQLDRWNSGALFLPLESNGQVIWVRVPGQKISELRGGQALVDNIIKALTEANELTMSGLQNILGTNALKKTEEGDWAIYPTNQNGAAQALPPLSVMRNGKWTTPLSEVVPNMNFDIGAKIAGGSAFHGTETALFVGDMSWNSVEDFIIDQVNIGFAPVTNAENEVLGWTHPLAPAYPSNDARDSKNFSNENTAKTQLKLRAQAVSTEVTEQELPKAEDELSKNLPDVTNPVIEDLQSRIAEAVAAKAKGAVPAESVTRLRLQLEKAIAAEAAAQAAKPAKTEGSRPAWLEELDGMEDDGIMWLDTERAAASNNRRRATKYEQEVAEAWFKENLPGVPFKRVAGLIKRNGTTGYGIFEAGAVAVSNQGIVGTEFHEAYHAVQEMFLSPERNAKVMAEAAKRYELDVTKDAKEIKEKLAEEFRAYMLSDGMSNREKSTIRRFFSELLELIKAVLRGERRAVKLMQDINAGKFANEVSDTTKEFATMNQLIMADIPEYDAKVQTELTQNLKASTFRGLRAVQRGKGNIRMQGLYVEMQRVAALDRAEFGTQNIEGEFGGMTRAEVQTNLMVKLGMEAMKMEAKFALAQSNDAVLQERFTALFTTNLEQVMDFMTSRPEVQKYMNGLMDQEFTSGTDTNEQYDETFEKMNPKDSLSQTVRSIIETTPLVSPELAAVKGEVREMLAAAQMAVQEGNVERARKIMGIIRGRVAGTATDTFFGLPQTMNVDLVFPYMSERLAHLSTPEDMFNALFEMGQVYPEFQVLAIRLQQEESWVQAQFFSAMRKGSTAEIVVKGNSIVTKDVYSGVLFGHAKQGIMVSLRDLAALRGETESQMAKNVAAGIAKQILKVKNLSNEAFVEQAEKILDAIGFTTLDPKARRAVLVMNSENVEFREELYRGLGHLAQQASFVIEAKEGQDLLAEKKLNNAITNLTRKFEKHDMGAVSTTFNNVEGKRIYSKQVPSFITEWFDQFTKGDLTNEQLADNLKNTLFRDTRMYATTFGKILFPMGPKGAFNHKAITSGAFRSFRVGGIEAGAGTTYTKMTDAQWWQLMLGSFNSSEDGIVYLPITTPSDATNSYMVPAIAYNFKNEGDVSKAKKDLHDMIVAEVKEMQVRGGRFANAIVNDFMKDKLQVEDMGEGMWKVVDTTVTQDVLDEAADKLFDALMAEGEAIERMPSYQKALDSQQKGYDSSNAAKSLAVAGYMSNMSVGIGLAGTHNEFKSHKGQEAQTVDMQKRHKHILSPGLANAGVTGRTHFRSVTMEETVLDLQELNDSLPEGYGKVEVADAQSYVSPAFYKDILEEHGDLTPEMEVAIDKAIAGEALNATEIKLLRPYKPFYYARIFNEETGMFESQQIKNSIFPVIKGLSPQFDEMNAWMTAKNIDQVQMGTAHKVGNTKKQTPLRNEDGTFNPFDLTQDNMEEYVYTLPMRGYRKQVNITDHWHSDSTNKLASQLEKIVIAAAVRNMGERGREIADEFIDALDQTYRDQLAAFFEQFQADGHAGVVDKTAFGEWLIDQIDDGSTPTYVLDLIKEGAFASPAVIGMVRSRLFTGVQQDVNTIRVKGGTQVQIASQFFRTNANRLRGMRMEDGKVMPAEIAVSRDVLPAKYRAMSIEEIRDEAPEVLKSITLRIPSEGMNSGAVAEIVEFLPEGMDGVIVPDEFVTQMGSDFDVDKLFFQFREGDKGTKDKMFDLQLEVFEDPSNLAEIMEPQGFEQFSEAASKRGIRSAKQGEFLARNPMSVATHMWMRSDNMAGVALKGQAANKNVILLDLIRYGFQWKADTFKINGMPVSFDGNNVSRETVRLHAAAVAAAMDGAKDPVYGKLGINEKNFGLFMEIVMFSGDLELAIDVIQSEAVQLESTGHIRIKQAKKAVEVVALTPEGKIYVEKLASAREDLSADSASSSIIIPGNSNFFSGGTKNKAEAEVYMAGAVGRWKKEVSNNFEYINGVMRSDKANVGKDIEKQLLRTPSEKGNYGTVRMSVDPNGKRDNETGFLSMVSGISVKGTMSEMFNKTADLLDKIGDGFLKVKSQNADNKAVQSMTSEQWDMRRRMFAAEEHTVEPVYTAMGERDTKSAKALPEDRSEWSLENWLRFIRTDKEMMANPDLAMVVSKLLVQTNPYNVNGTYFDNVTLVGVADDGELKLVTDAMDRLDASGNPDIFDFLGAMEAYEAQRSRYGTSQSRLTRILPTRTQRRIAEKVGAYGVLNESATFELAAFGDIVRTDVYNPNVPYLQGDSPSPADAIILAEKLNVYKVYKTTGNKLVIPTAVTDGEIAFSIVDSPNNGQKFAGKEFDVVGAAIEFDEKLDKEFAARQAEHEESLRNSRPNSETGKTMESRLSYKKDQSPEEKIVHLKERFRKSGIVVDIVIDNNITNNAQVEIRNGGAVIALHSDRLQGDTIVHEFGHILTEALGYEHPLIQQAINELRGTELWAEVAEEYSDKSQRDLEMEVLVTFLGRKGTEQFNDLKSPNKLRTILNKILRAVGKLFGIQPKATQQLIENLIQGQDHLSLRNVNTVQEQRRGTLAPSELVKFTRDEFKSRMEFLKQTQGTSVQAEEAFEIANERFRAITEGSVANRLEKMANVAIEVIDAAASVNAAMTAPVFMSGMKLKPTLSLNEAKTLNEADQSLNDLEMLMNVVESMAVSAGENSSPEIVEAFEKLKDQIDGLREAKARLADTVATALSNKLKANTSNTKLLEQMGDTNMFDLVNNPDTRKLMTDVDWVSAGTLGVKEFKNPVIQAIAKLTANTLEAARLDGKEAEAQLAAILENNGVTVGDLMENGAFIGEYNVDYFRAREAAAKEVRSGKNPNALLEFDAKNTITEFSAEYLTEWEMKNAAVIALRSRVSRLEGQLQAGFRVSDTRTKLAEARKELAESLKDLGADFTRFHETTFDEAAFAAAEAEAAAKQTAAHERKEDVGYEALTNEEKANLSAVRSFNAEYLVVNYNGKTMPTTGFNSEVTVREEFKNPDYTGTPMPGAQHRNTKWDNTPANVKQALTEVKDVLLKAAGPQGAKFVNQGVFPYYSTQASKTAKEGIMKELKNIQRSLKDAALPAGERAKLEARQKELQTEIAVDSRGNRIYLRSNGIFGTTQSEKNIAEIEQMDDARLLQSLQQFAKDAYAENAKRTLEPMAYLTREVFEGSEIIDGRHVIKSRKKGESLKQATKLAKGTNIAEALDAWYEGVLGDNWEDNTTMDAAVGYIQRYTSLMGVGLNIPAWFNNFAYGSIQRNLEFAGEHEFSKESSRSAHKLINGNLMDITKDLWSGKKSGFTSKASALIHTLDVADDQRELPFNMTDSMADTIISKAFIGQTLGEVVMQNQVLFAMMLEQQVRLEDGTTTNLYEAYTLDKNGNLSLPKGAVVIKKDGTEVELNNEFVASFRNRVKSLNHHIHGAYNKQDAGTWQRHWLGRLAMQFRRWLPMGVKKRFADRMYNESRERDEMGDYVALWEVMRGIVQGEFGKITSVKTMLEAIKDQDPLAYRNGMRALKEVSVGLGLTVALAALYAFGFDDDDELGLLGGFAVNRAERLRDEMFTYTPSGIYELFGQITKDPMASLSKVEGLGTLTMFALDDAYRIGTGEGIATYASGYKKGQSKTWRATKGMVPILGHAQRFGDLGANVKDFGTVYNWVN